MRSLKIFAVFLLVLGFSFMVLGNSDGPVNASTEILCETDRECPFSKYCYHSGICVACLNCSRFFRQDQIRCAKIPEDCGACIPGYESQSYAFARFRQCMKTVFAEPQKIGYDDKSPFINTQWLGIFVILCISTLGFAFYFCNKHRQRPLTISESWSMNEINTRHVCTQPPPPYKEEEYTDDSNGISGTFHLRITENPENDKQKAVPYFVENVCSEHNNVHHFNMPQNANLAEAAAYTSIHDENTVPSEWTPGPAYGISAHHENTIEHNNVETTSIPQQKKRKRGEDDDDAVPKKSASMATP